MRHTKITVFIALTAVFTFFLALSFTPPAGGETQAHVIVELNDSFKPLRVISSSFDGCERTRAR